MYIKFKNRGALVPAFLATCLIGASIIKALIEYLFTDYVFAEGDVVLLFGIAFLIAGYWTHKQRDSFYYVDGEKRRMNEENTFFYLSMELWAQIYWSFGFLCVLGGVLSWLGVAK